MTFLPLVRVSQFALAAEAAELLGVSAGSVCRQLGQPPWHDCDPRGYAPMVHMCRFLAAAGQAARSSSFGSAIVEVVPFDRLGALGLAVSRAPNVHQALKTAVRLLPGHVSYKKFWLVEQDDAVWICRGGGGRLETGDDVLSQFALRGLVQIVQRGAGDDWWPRRVVLQDSGPNGRPSSEGFASANVTYRPDMTAFAVPRDVLPLPMRHPRLDLREPPGPMLDEASFLATAPAETPAEALRQLIATLMPLGYPAIDTLAEITGLHPRTLQRLLQRESLSYRQLVDEVRAERATVLLRDSGAPVTEIAFDLGYTDVSHFIRAFRRWTGVSPSRYRNLRAAA
jgi:AraC-like DNA-binding protein